MQMVVRLGKNILVNGLFEFVECPGRLQKAGTMLGKRDVVTWQVLNVHSRQRREGQTRSFFQVVRRLGSDQIGPLRLEMSEFLVARLRRVPPGSISDAETMKSASPVKYP